MKNYEETDTDTSNKNDRESFTQAKRWAVFDRDKYTCQYCGRKAPEVELEVDHLVPISKGGTNLMSNLITACHDCNMGKGKHEVAEFTYKKKEGVHRISLVIDDDLWAKITNEMYQRKCLILNRYFVSVLREYYSKKEDGE